MQVTDTKWLRHLKPGDYVNATFSDIDDQVISCEGKIERITNDSITIGKTYGLWQLLSLVCIEKDFSFIRENSVTSDLERLTMLLGG